ncbi:DUF4136 domain-containing protein [Aquiflexum sp. TKW24L]|uniref:DUF4136 domain-containing protein n=1 Tax=Aquiflexum sp. TKW24L TaxID=2942212 RepID=UPI0020BE0657|nr:DUF4136 domain-containing protein [Aquiflexum sp. TKW24L]MCL6260930.1 DUF4136 domain-containing protein [Aquiflexum sp. TKW24L]
MKNLNLKHIIGTVILTAFTATLVIGQEIHTAKHDKVDMKEYQKYEWVLIKENIPEDQLVFDGSEMLISKNTSTKKLVKDAIDAQMKANGFTHDTANPDMLVTFQILEEPTELRTFTMTTGQTFLGFGPKSMDAKMVPVEEGTIIVNFIDANTGSQLWQGFASGAFEKSGIKEISDLQAKVIAIFNDWNFKPFGE